MHPAKMPTDLAFHVSRLVNVTVKTFINCLLNATHQR